MALVQFPTLSTQFERRITSFSIDPWNPGQEVKRNRVTGAVSVFDRFPGLWRGVHRIGETNDEGDAQDIESWILSLDGARNWTNLPLLRSTIPNDLTITAVDVSLQRATVRGSLTGVRQGFFCSVGGRLMGIRAITGGNTLTLWPYVPSLLPVGATIAPAMTILARRREGTGISFPAQPQIYGPWTFEWEEKV